MSHQHLIKTIMTRNEIVHLIMCLEPSDGRIVTGKATQEKVLHYGKFLYDLGKVKYRLASRKVGKNKWKVVAV